MTAKCQTWVLGEFCWSPQQNVRKGEQVLYAYTVSAGSRTQESAKIRGKKSKKQGADILSLINVKQIQLDPPLL